MTETKEKIILGAKQAFERYGIKRTTMSDVAMEAGVSRQTLYAVFGSKEQVIAEAIGYSERNRISAVRSELPSCRSLSEQLDLYFQETVIEPSEHRQKMPGANDIWGNLEIFSHPAVIEVLETHQQLLSELFIPFTEQIGKSDQSPAQLAGYVLMVCKHLKTFTNDREILDQRLHTLKATILALVSTK